VADSFDIEIVLRKVHNFSQPFIQEVTGGASRRTKEITSLDPNRSTATILLVEDEEPLRHVVIDLLTQLGYHVLGAANGNEALAMAERHPANIDVLITDVLMPELAGPELAVALRSSRPKLKVIFVSGDTSCQPSLVEGAALLQKPFTIKMLSSKVREVLQG
jgi:two-component system cell cycle sensor histidine kinase/response regulator CckA